MTNDAPNGSSGGTPELRLGDIVRVNDKCPFSGDWQNTTVKVVSLRIDPHGKQWVSVIEGEPSHRGYGVYDGETTDFDADYLSLVEPRAPAQEVQVPAIWVCFVTPKGPHEEFGIRAWTTKRERAEQFREEGLDMQAFYAAAPASPAVGGASEFDPIKEALEAAEQALNGCYEVQSYPGDGSSGQDAALEKVRGALSSLSSTHSRS